MYAISLMFAMQTVCSKFRQSILWPHSMAFCLPPEINKKTIIQKPVLHPIFRENRSSKMDNL